MTRSLRKILTGSVFVSAMVFGACSNASVETADAVTNASEATVSVVETIATQPAAEAVKAETVKYASASQPTVASQGSIVNRADALFQKYVQPLDAQGLARFNYAALKSNAADFATLNTYISHLEGQDASTLSDNDALAYWANLYNAVTVKLIIDNYPLKSIKKIGNPISGPWGKKIITVNGNKVSLNDIEHNTMRKNFANPEFVHYMVNCASVGCPNLKDGLWKGATLEADRIEAAKTYINSPRGAKITSNGIIASEIFKWYKVDFGSSKQNLLQHFRQYAGPELAAAIDGGATIQGYDYDWNLNE